MNDVFVMLGIEPWKPVIGALLLPPVPFVLLMLAGARLIDRSRRLAWVALAAGALGTWLMCTVAVGSLLSQLLLAPPPSLSPAQADRLKGADKTAIVVLGGGGKGLMPEYGAEDLSDDSIERLRYGVWLSRRTGLPLAYSGGIGHGGRSGPAEAEIATRIAEHELHHPLRWTEARSRDTNENALLTLPLLQAQGIRHIVLVTHGFHMTRALAAFERASQRTSIVMQVTPAAVGSDGAVHVDARSWLPSRIGFAAVNHALHEWLGRVGGA